MSITDELRKVAATLVKNHMQGAEIKSLKYCLIGCADRIDEAHESACKRERGEGIRIAEEAALDEMRQEYVKLPVDADGVPIHVGERVEGLHGENADATHLTVHEDGSWDVGTRGWVPHLLRHRRAPTVEDVLCNFGIEWECSEDGEDKTAVLKEYAAKLRLAGSDAE